jgi:L-arabinokinase
LSIVFYITGHGFGHASRQIEIINAIYALDPAAPIVVRTSAPRWLFEKTLRGPADVQAAATDTGAIQRGALDIDVPETIRRAAEFHADPAAGARIDDEVRALKAVGARLVVGDVPPLAFAAAARAGVPSVAISNFTWDWIYEGYSEELPHAPWLIDRLRSWYAQATEAWLLPMAGGFEGMNKTLALPFVARHARHARADVRARLGLPASEPLMLISFGGYNANDLDPARAATTLTAARIVVTSASKDGHPAGTIGIDEDTLYGSGLRYEDLVAAVDIVLTKPGYGIVSECIANGTRLLYTSRGRFAEYDVFIEEMPAALPCQFISRTDLAASHWQDATARLLALPAITPPPTNGAAVAAERILSKV